jgi:hypothetical protein
MTVGNAMRYPRSHRLYYVGEQVPIPELVAQASVMIIAEDRQGRHVPIGTGFLVAMPGPAPETASEYLVTAAHVVRFCPKTFVRISLHNADPIDLPIPKWIFHDDDETDVAVSPIRLDQGFHNFKMIPIEMFLDELSPELHLGDDVYFVGLLNNIKSMHGQNVPMVRSGALGRLYQDEVLIKWPDLTVHSMTAHLVDCRSHSGFSGSPCYVQFPSRGRVNAVAGQDTYLLGLITGHLDELGVDKSVKNTGVGLVTPVEDIRHVLMQEAFVKDRQVHEEMYRQSHPDPQEVAVMDSAQTTTQHGHQ